MYIDSHCHLDKLDLTPYTGDVAGAVAAARARQVAAMVCIGIDIDAMPGVVGLAERFEDVWATVGVHPLYREHREPTFTDLCQWAQHPKVIGIGETGLDYFYGEGDLEWQRDRFRVHIEAARETALPLIIHTRGAKEDTLRLLQEVGRGQVRGVLHCFTEDLEMAEAAIDLGFYISISGIVTFNNATALRDVVSALPLERLLIETDSPWLAPVPHRGKKNEPQYVVEVAQRIAELKQVDPAQVADITSANFYALFTKAEPT